MKSKYYYGQKVADIVALPEKNYTTPNGREFKTRYEKEAYILGMSDMAINLMSFSENILRNALIEDDEK